ncbi:MAG TPA: tripartite tricarboxylate transporter substrate binding protein [Xanthobacteraceae bacterium]|nr:tripartite tricarboxylate transporter substrate binding protein [Xanthobacteraceae bacterium]
MRILFAVGASPARLAGATMLALGLALTALSTSPAWPDSYPNRPIHLIVNFAPGGTGDIVARLVGAKLQSNLGVSVIVENRPGAGGTLGARDVANATPDGYTLTVAQTPEIAINPFFMTGAGYDPLKDLQPLALAGVVPLALVVPSNAPYSTMADFVKFLRTGPAITFASAGVGTPGHLAGEYLKLKLDNKLTHVPYKGAGPALNDVVGGQVDFYFPGFPAALPLTQGGKVKLLAVSSATRAPAAPDIPTVAEATGIANFDFTLWAGFFGPHGMAPNVANKLNTEINKVLLEPDIKSRLENDGAQVSPLSIPQFAAFVQREIDKYKEIIKAADIKSE